MKGGGSEARRQSRLPGLREGPPHVQLAAGPTLAYGESKRLIADSLSNTVETQLEMETRAIAGLARESEDAVNAINAFVRKEKPEFKGR